MLYFSEDKPVLGKQTVTVLDPIVFERKQYIIFKSFLTLTYRNNCHIQIYCIIAYKGDAI